jgi:hypothetical protein
VVDVDLLVLGKIDSFFALEHLVNKLLDLFHVHFSIVVGNLSVFDLSFFSRAGVPSSNDGLVSLETGVGEQDLDVFWSYILVFVEVVPSGLLVWRQLTFGR